MSEARGGGVHDSGSGVSLHTSVVKIFTRSVHKNFASPWKSGAQRSSTGSGLCIDCVSRRVLTNAHVVASAVSVRVRKHGDSVRYSAKVLCTSPQCDLALLEVTTAAFWEGVSTISLTEAFPSLDSDVLTIGYPQGGDNISVTRGVVSRIDLMDYTFSPFGGERLPVIQVDAAINPGNSGGPVIGAGGQAVGVAFAGLSSSNNIGYVIPGAVALFFLRGFASTGGFTGLCSLGVRVQPMQSPALRRWHGCDKPGRGGGVLITSVAPHSPSALAGLLGGDVLLSIDGVPISEDGTVHFGDEGAAGRIGFDYLSTRKVSGELFSVEVASGSGEKEGSEDGRRVLQLQAAPVQKLVPRIDGVDANPSYLIVGGLVMVPFSFPWLAQRFPRSVLEAPPELVNKLTDFKDNPDEEVVILDKVLAADVNYGYEDLACMQVLEFGSGVRGVAEETPLVKVRSLVHLRDMVDAARETSGFLRFKLSTGLDVVLDATECRTSRNEILEQYAVPSEWYQSPLVAGGVPVLGASSRL